MEIWDVLDENGNYTGKTMEKFYPLPEGYYHLGADVWIMNSDNKILLQKRAATKRLDPNKWAMTGGSVVSGETSLETIERETEEELGIKLNMKDLRLVKHFRTGAVWLDAYLIKQDIDLNDIKMQENEVSEVRWMTYDEAEEIFNKGEFMPNRWEFVRDIIKAEKKEDNY